MDFVLYRIVNNQTFWKLVKY